MKVTKLPAIVAVSASLALAGAPVAAAAPDENVFVPFDEATVVDPNTVTFVTGGVLAADGTNLCAVNPGSIVFPDGTYPCFIDFESPGPDAAPQVGQMPVGGVDTGVATQTDNLTAVTTLATIAAGTGSLALALVLLRRRTVRS